MILFISLLILFILGFLFRDYLFSFFLYLKKRAEGKKLDLSRLNSLRADLFHEGKKKFAGLEQIVSSWSKKESTIQEHLDYFHQLISQLKTLIEQQRENLFLSSEDIFIYAKLKKRIAGIESKIKRQRIDDRIIKAIAKDLKKLQEEIEKNVEKATKRFSFNFVDLVKDAVRTVKIEKREILEKQKIDVIEDYKEIKKQIRLPYSVYKDWLRVLANLIRNSMETFESQVSSHKLQVSKELSLDSEMRDMWVKVSVMQPETKSLLVMIEDNGMGMDEETKNNFYKKGFTRKDTGLGLGVTEESLELIHRYGDWQVESELGKGTKITIEVEKEKAEKKRIEIEGKRTILQRAFPSPIRVVLVGLFLVVVGLGIWLSVDKYSRFWEDWNPQQVEVKRNTLKVLNRKNEVLWTKEFASLIGSPPDGQPSPIIEDINRDGRKEVIVTLSPTDTSSGRAICMDFRGRELWNFYSGRKSIYDVEPDVFFPNIILLKDLDGDGKIEVIINNRVSTSFSDYLIILDAKGMKKSEYWHPGLIEVVHCKDINNDGKVELICGGINNRMDWRPCFLVLDSRKIYGQAMPYRGEKRVPPARELVYILFPHFKIEAGVDFSWEHCLDYVYLINMFSERTDSTIYQVTTSRFSITWYLEKHFRVKNLAYNLGVINEKLSEMKIPYVVTEDDMKEIRNIEVWKDGVRIR